MVREPRSSRETACASRPSAKAASTLEITLNLPGRHNVQNALAAIAVATELGVPDAAIRKALAEFRASRQALPALRRDFSSPRTAGRAGSFTLVDDYGHHPVESGRRSMPREALFRAGASCSPQPHRYTRRATCSRIS